MRSESAYGDSVNAGEVRSAMGKLQRVMITRNGEMGMENGEGKCKKVLLS